MEKPDASMEKHAREINQLACSSCLNIRSTGGGEQDCGKTEMVVNELKVLLQMSSVTVNLVSFSRLIYLTILSKVICWYAILSLWENDCCHFHETSFSHTPLLTTAKRMRK